MCSSFQVVGHLPIRLLFLAIDEHLHFPLFGTDDHGLLAHPPHHVERTARLPPQRQFQHVLRRLATKHVQPHHVAGVIIEKADEVGVLASQPEGKDIGLPHLVGSGALKEAWLGWMALGLGLTFLEQLLLV
jgi:hypothetical protein